jgi:hypothetical protein
MKYIHKYNDFLLEGFDLSKHYQQQNIIPEIQDEANSIMINHFDSVLQKPVDMVRSRDKVEFWIAKQIKRSIMAEFEYLLEIAYNRRHKDNDEYVKISKFYEYIKGKISKEELGNEYENLYLDYINEYLFDFTSDTVLFGIFDYFLSPIRNIHEPINLITTTLDEMDTIQRAWHNSIKATNKIQSENGKVIMTFPDGYYWSDLQTNSNDDEADAMGHCGRTGADTILSLRKKSNGGFIEPFVTIAINYYDENKSAYRDIQQIKGKNNKKPINKYHPYIVELLLNKELKISSIGSEYSPQDDFHVSDLSDVKLIKHLLMEKPKLANRDDIIDMYKKKMLDEDFVNSYYNKLISSLRFHLDCVVILNGTLITYNLKEPEHLNDTRLLLSIEDIDTNETIVNQDDMYYNYNTYVKFLRNVIIPWSEEKNYSLWSY